MASVVRAEMARLHALERGEREAAEFERLRCPSGGGCRLCGLSHCGTVDEGGSVAPGWHDDGQAGWHCEQCDQELYGRPDWIEVDRRVQVALGLLGRVHSIPMRALADPGAFRSLRVWWSEQPGAAPAVSLGSRWSHVDVDRLRTEFAEIAGESSRPPAVVAEEPPLEPCPSCGMQRWKYDYRGTGWLFCFVPGCGWVNGTPFPTPAANEDAGAGRGRADTITARLLDCWQPEPFGTDPLAGLAARAGFRYFYESGRTSPNAVPWGHLNVAKMRRAAGLVAA